MPFGSYANLLTSVQAWLARDASDDPIVTYAGDMVTLFEGRANKEIRSRYGNVFGTLVVDTTSANPQMIPLPADYLEAAVTWNSATNPPPSAYPPGPFLYPFDLKSPQQQVRDPAFYNTGIPYSYSIQGNFVVLGKMPDANYTFGFTYYGKLPPLVTNNMNWLLQNYPELYLFGSLAEAATFIQDDTPDAVTGAVSRYEARCQDALNSMRKAERDARLSGAPLAVRNLG